MKSIDEKFHNNKDYFLNKRITESVVMTQIIDVYDLAKNKIDKEIRFISGGKSNNNRK